MRMEMKITMSSLDHRVYLFGKGIAVVHVVERSAAVPVFLLTAHTATLVLNGSVVLFFRSLFLFHPSLRSLMSVSQLFLILSVVN